MYQALEIPRELYLKWTDKGSYLVLAGILHQTFLICVRRYSNYDFIQFN
jgi:hypothetical protein